MNTRLVYTAIYGGYDEPAKFKRPIRTDMVLYSDRDYQTRSWEVRVVPSQDSPKMAAKRHKVLMPEGYEQTLWIDGNVTMCFGGWEDLVMTIEGNRDLAFFRHPARDCLYQEAKVCKQMGLDDVRKIDEQVSRYRGEGMPEHFGLWGGGIIYRREAPMVREVMQMWMDEIERGSVRDQISLPYVLWKTGYKPGAIRGDLWDHTLFKIGGHK